MSDHNRTDADAPPDLPGLTGEAALAPQEPAPAPAGVPAETETRSSAAEDGQSAAPGHAVTDSDDAKSRLPRDLPVLPVRDMVVFPGTIVPLNVAREKSKRLIDAVLSGDKLLVAVAQ
ncbi:MAG: LON peptidase substrate-binding domain-containing protein, partial [Planctomycetota bacterium]